ncbi:hypothetical protein BJ165DRAFT_1567287 [Panaeolus papilionaceus]|nr:hypothetical protein BJ165DRAFT_1567287 [Panaeolus papilionaceus]
MPSINHTGMPGSRQRTIDMLQAYLQLSKQAVALTIVTTMWDTLHGERSHQHAESHYAQLKDDIFKEFSNRGATAAQFTNTKRSALEILDMGPGIDGNSLRANLPLMDKCLYQDLHGRINNALRKKGVIETELAQPEAKVNPEFRCLLEKDYEENKQTLTTFTRDFVEMGFPLVGFEEAHYRLLKILMGSYIPHTTSTRIFALRCLLKHLVRNV